MEALEIVSGIALITFVVGIWMVRLFNKSKV